VLGLFASQILHMAIDDTADVWGPVHMLSPLGTGVPAALTFGVASGLAALTTLRLAGDRDPVPSPVVAA
jgi:hypothetical protein